MMVWIFSAIILVSALSAVLATNVRTSALALWLTSLAVGGIYLTVGAEELAIIQWIVATLIAISFSFFSAMFDEQEGFHLESRKRIAFLSLALLVGATFVAIVFLGWFSHPVGSFELPSVGAGGNDILALGRTLTEKHLLSLEVLAVTLFVVLIGGGVIARPEKPEIKKPETEKQGPKERDNSPEIPVC
jgi:NADH-quinone oxidoreductase subunit J